MYTSDSDTIHVVHRTGDILVLKNYGMLFREGRGLPESFRDMIIRGHHPALTVPQNDRDDRRSVSRGSSVLVLGTLTDDDLRDTTARVIANNWGALSEWRWLYVMLFSGLDLDRGDQDFGWIRANWTCSLEQASRDGISGTTWREMY